MRTFYNSTLTPGPQTVEIYATPLIDRSALNVLALFAQDSYSVKRLTLTGGLRWEQPRRLPAGAKQPAERVLSPTSRLPAQPRATKSAMS